MRRPAPGALHRPGWQTRNSTPTTDWAIRHNSNRSTCSAPALLDAAVRGSLVVEMFVEAHIPTPRSVRQPALPGRDRHRRAKCLLTSTSWMRAGHGALCAAYLRHSDDTPGLAASMNTKMLHRKRPISSRSSTARSAKFYGTIAIDFVEVWQTRRSGDFHTNQTAIDKPRTRCNAIAAANVAAPLY